MSGELVMPLGRMMFDGTLHLPNTALCWTRTSEEKGLKDIDTSDLGCSHMLCNDCFWSRGNMNRLGKDPLVAMTNNGNKPSPELRAKGDAYVIQLIKVIGGDDVF